MLSAATYSRVPSVKPVDSAVLSAFRSELGEQAVDASPTSLESWSLCTTGTGTKPSAVVRPINQNQVQTIVRLANEFGTPLYPVSRGKNWGYGTANAVIDGCVIVDLSRMNRIIEVDDEFGIVTLEPGVTQGQLWSYLDERKIDLLVPVHGGGPACSIIGNLLERGYGITPIADHFQALTSLEAVLPDGSIYRSAIAETAGNLVDRLFKWGYGPYVDGLFSQSAFGIVTQATIALARRPERIEVFMFSVKQSDDLVPAITTTRQILSKFGGITGPINLMNAERVLAMFSDYPRDVVPPGRAIPPELCRRLMDKCGVPTWTGVGALYGATRVVRAAKKEVRALLSRAGMRRIRFISPDLVSMISPVLSYFQNWLPREFVQQADALKSAIRYLGGVPDERALRLAYWKSESNAEVPFDPARDQCGLIWYSPLVPMSPDIVMNYINMVRRSCSRFDFEPLITLTSLSERLFDSTVPILFEIEQPGRKEAAHACYDELYNNGKAMGLVPYRYGTSQMQRLTSKGDFWSLVQKLKASIDPKDIIAPGRYCPTTRPIH